MNIVIDQTLKTPIYLQIATQLKSDIFSGKIAPGSKLPSERYLANLLKVHRNTVVKAYNELKAEDIISSTQGVGYVVNLTNEITPFMKEKRVNWRHQIKEEYIDMEVTFDNLFQHTHKNDVISLSGGLASTEIFDKKQVADNIAEILTVEGEEPYFYTPFQGAKSLRQRLVQYVSTKGIKANTSEIQVLKETNQAIDFLTSLLIKEGDYVIIEEPVSPDVYRTIDFAGGLIKTVPVDENGMCVDLLEPMIRKYNPKFIYVNSSFHDPTGKHLSAERRRKLIEISNRNRTIIIEEDGASDLSYEGVLPPPIKSIDTLENVIYIYSFSLTFIPGLNLGFVVANKEVVKRLSYMVSVRTEGLDWLPQKFISKYFMDSGYYVLLEKFKKNYMDKRNVLCTCLEKLKPFGIEFEKPEGGVYVWCKLPKGIDSKAFAEEALKRGLSVAPGHIFYPARNGGRDRVRLNYSYESAERIEKGVRIFEETLKGLLAHEK